MNIFQWKRFGKEGVLDDGVIYLASDETSYVTGVVLPIDGGYIYL